MTIPSNIIDLFLEKNGFGGFARSPLRADASFRSYDRLRKESASWVLMKAPPDKEDTRPFAALADFLVAKGFSAPQIKARDYEHGLLLLEDLEDDTFNVVLAKDPAQEEALYQAAIDVLVDLHGITPPARLPLLGEGMYSLKPYDEALLFRELFLFSEWYVPEVVKAQKPEIENTLRDIFQNLFKTVTGMPPVLTLRDYHADNLMWLPARDHRRRVGLLDFQDAVLGHPAYDLVSLLQDARRRYQPALEKQMIERYLSQRPNAQDFMSAYQILGAQRNMKIIGIFTRLWRRDGKERYPKMIPHVWSLLEANLQHEALRPLKIFLDQLVPPPLRLKSLT